MGTRILRLQYIGNILQYMQYMQYCNILLPEANIAIYAVCLRRILRYCNILYSEATIYCSIYCYCSYYLLYGLMVGLIFEEVEIFVSASLAMKLREYTRNTPIRRNPVSKFWKKNFLTVIFWIFVFFENCAILNAFNVSQYALWMLIAR